MSITNPEFFLQRQINRWQERPLAVVVICSEHQSTKDLRTFLTTGKVDKFWIPEYWAFTDEIAKTRVDKLDKKLLRASNENGALHIQVVQ